MKVYNIVGKNIKIKKLKDKIKIRRQNA